MIVDIAVPNTGTIRTGLAAALLRLAFDGRYALNFSFRIAQPVANNCNQIVQQFLGLPEEHAYLLILGSNVVPLPEHNPLDLVELDCDVVGLPCPIWKGERDPGDNVVWNIVGSDRVHLWQSPRGRLLQVEGIGSGAMLIARRVLEHSDMRGPFRDMWDANGVRTVGEDLQFCYRANAAGFTVWAALDYVCEHEKLVPLGQVGNMQEVQYGQ